MTCFARLILLGMMLGFATAARAAEVEIGQIKTLTGTVHLIRHQVATPAKLGDLVESADILTTGPASSVGITFIDDSRFSLGAQSRLELQQFQFDPTTQEGSFIAAVHRGTLAIQSGAIAKRSPQAMQVKTPTTILGVRGTKFLVKVDE